MNQSIGKIVRQRLEHLKRAISRSSALHCAAELIVERLVTQENSTFGFHSRNCCVHIWRRRKQKIFYHVNLIPKTEQTKTRLKNANVSFPAGYDDLVPCKERDVIHDLLLSSEIKEVFFEHFCRRNHVLADLYRQATFSGDWPLERENDRDFEIAEQPSKVACVGPYLGPKR